MIAFHVVSDNDIMGHMRSHSTRHLLIFTGCHLFLSVVPSIQYFFTLAANIQQFLRLKKQSRVRSVNRCCSFHGHWRLQKWVGPIDGVKDGRKVNVRATKVQIINLNYYLFQITGGEMHSYCRVCAVTSTIYPQISEKRRSTQHYLSIQFNHNHTLGHIYWLHNTLKHKQPTLNHIMISYG